MTFLQKAQQKEFWINVAKVTIPFFIVVLIISLIIASSRDIFSGNWEAVNQANFANGKWQRFFGFKIVFSFLYGVYMANKNMK